MCRRHLSKQYRWELAGPSLGRLEEGWKQTRKAWRQAFAARMLTAYEVPLLQCGQGAMRPASGSASRPITGPMKCPIRRARVLEVRAFQCGVSCVVLRPL